MSSKKPAHAAQPQNDTAPDAKRQVGLCGLGQPCERDRVHAPERLSQSELGALRLCPGHREALGKVAQK